MWFDETCFTKLSFRSSEWSAAKQNISVDQKESYTGYSSALVTVSAEEGIELYDIFDEAFKTVDVISHLKELRERNEDVPLAIFMDNAKIHDNV